MTRTLTWVAIAVLLALGACSKKAETPPSGGAKSAGSGGAMSAGSGGAMSAGSGSSAGSASAAGSESAAAAAVDVPTEMDFENDVVAKITEKNVEAELQALEKELERK